MYKKIVFHKIPVFGVFFLWHDVLKYKHVKIFHHVCPFDTKFSNNKVDSEPRCSKLVQLRDSH